MSIKALFFDFYDTIVKDDSTLIRQFSEEFSGLCGRKTAEINSFWWKSFHYICDNSSGVNYRTQRNIEIKTLECVMDNFGIKKSAEKYLDRIFSYWENPVPYNDALNLLKNTSLPVYIVSNIDTSDINKALENNNLAFNGTLTSEDVKSYKPDPVIFEKALSEFRFQPDEVFHIGDSLNADIRGANNCGIKSIWINRKNNKDKNGILPYREYDDLNQFYNDFKEILNS